MYLIGCFMGITLAALAWLSRREEGKVLMRMSVYLYKKGCIHKAPLLNAPQVQKELENLHPGQSGLLLQGDYYTRKIKLVLAVLLLGTLVGVLVRVKAETGGSLTIQGELLRPQPGKGDKQVELQAFLEGRELGRMTVMVPERQLTEQETRELYEIFWERLSREALGENPSWRQVYAPLTLTEELEGYPFAVSWRSGNYEVLSNSGAITCPETPTEVMLKAEIRYLDYTWQEELKLLVVPRPLTETELLVRQAGEAYYRAQEADAEKDKIRMPTELEEMQLTWKEIQEDHSLLVLFLTMAAAAAVFLLQDRDLHQQVLKRREEMKAAYPVALNKLILYLGAGMTIRGAFQKIALDYQKRQTREKQKPLYEEMLYACNQLQSGISESRVYELWAARTGLQDCARLSTMLIQNLKKGNAALLPRLKEEGKKALQEELNLRRKRGEEAGTRLLVPMVMMMAIVLVLVMIPAFQSFGI